jgi:hypothetical protein
MNQDLISKQIAKLLQASSSNLQSKFFVLCPQLHRVIVKAQGFDISKIKWNKNKKNKMQEGKLKL